MPDPRYRQIAADLRRRIESGEWSDGERRLPPEPALEEEYGASRNTIREAVKWLTTRGLVSTQPGRGTFVNEKIRPFITTLSADQATGLGGGEGVAFTREAELQFMVPVTTEPEVGIQRAKGDTAQGLRVPEGESLVFRHQKRFIDTRPYSLQTSFYPMSLVQRGAMDLLNADNIERGTVAYLRETLGIKQAGYRDVIRVRPPDATETAFFNLPEDGSVAILETLRTAYDSGGLPFRLTMSVFPADRNHFAINVGDVPDEVVSPDSTG
ncbi:MAG: transcriptional regulator, GntR family [Streptosporangiaceae bacterium]|nr:transcriptional regulator, GntR family [Streptosporangiaceae bacterium]